MLSEKDMKKTAQSYLTELEKDLKIPLLLIESETIDHSFFTVFFYNSSEYIKQGDPSAMLVGNAPFIVNKNNGSIHITGTDQPIELYMEKYKHKHMEN
jgi:hypothetical protein